MLTEKSFNTGEIVVNFAEGEDVGKPLVLLHGGTVNWQSWDEFLPALVENWQVYAPDLRGHGKTEKAESGYAIDNFVSDITAFIEGQVGKPVVLAGMSLGASIALGVAARLPGLVRALILLEPGLCYFRDAEIQQFGFFEWFSWIDQTHSSSQSFDDVLARCKQREPDNDEAATLSLAQMVYNLDPRYITDTINKQVFKDYKPEQLLKNLVCPTLLVYGEASLGSVLNNDDIAIFKKAVPQGRTFHVKDDGHGVIWGPTGQAVLTQVLQFLNSV